MLCSEPAVADRDQPERPVSHVVVVDAVEAVAAFADGSLPLPWEEAAYDRSRTFIARAVRLREAARLHAVRGITAARLEQHAHVPAPERAHLGRTEERLLWQLLPPWQL